MNDLNYLKSKFSIKNTVTIKQDSNEGLVYIEINNNKCSSVIYLQGAHLTSWVPRHSKAVIWLSRDATFTANKSIRGGIPICWPWFGAHHSNSNFPAHGYVRTINWNIISTTVLDSNTTKIILGIDSDTSTKQQYLNQAELKCIFTIGETLELELVTYNLSSEDIVITEALHSYFNISDVRHITVKGLEGTAYLDKLKDFRLTSQIESILINEEIDRIYIATTNVCILEDIGFNRRIIISKKGSKSTIVWNPWVNSSKTMTDLGASGYLEMLCIESGNAADDAVTIEPYKKHKLYVKYEVQQL